MSNNIWAQNATSVVDTPPVSLQNEGFKPGNPLPANFANWLFQRIQFLAITPGAAIQRYDAGASVVIDQVDTDQQPGSEQSNAATTPSNPQALDVDGQYVVYAPSGASDDLQMVDREDLGTVVRTFTRTSSGTLTDVICDGTYVVCADQNGKIECFDQTTGTSQWEYDHGVTVNGLASDGTYVYFGGSTNGSSKEAGAIHIAGGSAGTALWTIQHGAAVNSVAYSSGRVFLRSFVASSLASGAHLRCVKASNGFDKTGECGAGTDALIGWDVVEATPQPASRSIAADNDRLATTYPSGATYQLEVRSLTDGQAVGQFSDGSLSYDLQEVVIDQRYIIAIANPAGNPYLIAFDKRDGSQAWVTPQQATSHVATDGFRVYLTGSSTIRGMYRGNQTQTVCRRADTSHAYLPYRLQLIPQEGT